MEVTTLDIRTHYSELFKKYGDSPHAVQWSDSATQMKRFEILCEIGDVNNCSILDFGCGVGHLFDFLKGKGHKVTYTGVDVVDEMLAFAQQKHSDARFCKFENISGEKFDYVLISGVFNNRMESNRSFYRRTLRQCFELCVQGMAFNMMSSYVDFRNEELFYEEPEEAFRFCKEELSPRVAIRNDYLLKEKVIPYEFCTYVYRM